MSDNPQGQAPDPATTQTTTTPPTDPNAPGESGAGATTTLEGDALKAELDKVRKEAAEWRTKLRKFEAAEAERQKSEMTETERLKAELEEHRAKVAAAEAKALDASVRAAAAKLGFADPSDATRFIDREGLSDDAGDIEARLKAVLKAKPYLGSAKVPASGGENPGGGAVRQTDAQRIEDIKKQFPALANRV